VEAEGFLEDHSVLQEGAEVAVFLLDPVAAVAGEAVPLVLVNEVIEEGDVLRKSKLILFILPQTLSPTEMEVA